MTAADDHPEDEMALYELLDQQLQPAARASFAHEGIHERRDLQQWLINCPSALGEDLFILTEEFCGWEDSKRRIDLLALDGDANLVVIELKRTDDGGHMDLQAIRYAAMVSALSFEDVVRAHEDFLSRRNQAGNARTRILEFLELADGEPAELSTVPRIVLVAADFSIEITTTVLWLAERGLDIRCVQVQPYKLADGRIYLEVRQLLPLEDASGYQVKIRKKDETVRIASTGKYRERTLPTLARLGLIEEGTVIEIVPRARPADASVDANLYRARIVDPYRAKSVVWLEDGKPYSVTELTALLCEGHGVSRLMNNTYVHWRVVGQHQSLWDHSESLTRGERIVNSGA